MPPNENNELEVDPPTIKASGTETVRLGKGLNGALPDLRAVDVEAGDFPEADAFEKHVTNVIGSVATSVEFSSALLTDIGNDLTTISTRYQKTEGQNIDEAKKIVPLLPEVKEILPGPK